MDIIQNKIDFMIVPEPMRKAFESRVLEQYYRVLKEEGTGYVSSDMDVFREMENEIKQVASFNLFGNTQKYISGLNSTLEKVQFNDYLRDFTVEFMVDVSRTLTENRVFYYFEYDGETINEPIKEVW